VKNINILLSESDTPTLVPLTRFRSAFTLRDGIFSMAERLRIPAYLTKQTPGLGLEIPEGSSVDFFYENTNKNKENLFAADCVWTGSAELKETPAVRLMSDIAEPISLLNKIGRNILNDIKLLNPSDWKHPDTISSHSSVYPGVHFIGNSSDVWIHNLAEILPGSVLDARNGPVVIDEKCRISPFTYIEGPFYGGKGAMLDNVRITGGVIIGHFCRVGGEIENSVVNDYSNKHHEGFLGHSVLGSWVNIGALATTSDLKNNYGEIRLMIDKQEVETGTIKFGSIIADHVKVSVGIMMNTGTVIDAGSNIFGGSPGKYVGPLSWGLTGGCYESDRFLKDAEKIMLRRKQSPSASFSALLKML
jgi:glucose-1-phosphate thymidylyltransferase